jgi:hypothetical protein
MYRLKEVGLHIGRTHKTQIDLFCNLIYFCSGLCKIPIRLIGEGISPVLKISHPYLVEMGDVCVGDSEIHDFEITNPSRVSVTLLFYMASTISPELFSLNLSKKRPKVS